MSSGGTNTVTSNTAPPPQFQNALAAVGNQAQQVAQTPYQQYPGQLQAALSPDQLSAINSIQGLQGAANPYINAAAQEIGNSTAQLAPTIMPWDNRATSLFDTAAAAPLSQTVEPGIANANSMFNQSARQLTPTQFSAGQIGQYESPYTQQVVNATQAEFNNQNRQQQQAVEGNAISQGAFGGDREAVAQGITAGQQQLAQAPVIANLKNQGYAQALQEFNQQQQVGLGAQQATQQLQQGAGQGILAASGQGLTAAQQQAQNALAAGQGFTGVGSQVLGAQEANAWLNSQAGYGLANLGNEALNSGLTAANAQLGVGGLEQQQAQQGLNIPYEQFIQQQAYPFQTTAWGSGIAGQLANAAGGTASTTSPGPSPISQIAGLGITGLAGYGLLSNAGLLGGGAAAGGAAAGTAAAIDAGTFAAPEIAGALGGAALLARDGGAIPHRAGGGGIMHFPVHRTRMPGTGGGITANDNHFPQMTMPRLAAGGVAIPQLPIGQGGGIVGGNGISIPQLATTGLGRGIGAAGGSVSDYLAGQAAGAYHPPPTPAPMPAPAAAAAPVSPAGPGILSGLSPDQQKTLLDMIQSNQSPGGGGGGSEGGSGGGFRRGGGIIARRADGGPFGDDDSDMPVPPIPPDQPPSGGIGLRSNAPPSGQVDDGGAPSQSAYRSPWMALLAAGLGTMAGTSPHALSNIGRGGLEGLQMGEQQQVRQEQAALRRLQQQDLAAYRQGQLQNTADRNDTYAQRADTYAQRAQAQSSTDQARAALMMARASQVQAGHTTEGDILGQAVGSLANGKTLNPDTGQPWTRSDALMHIKGVDARVDQGNRRLDQGDRHLDQGDERIDQSAQRISAGQDAQQARLAAQQRGQDMTATNAAIHAAATMVASGSVPDFKTAYARITGVVAPSGAAAPVAAPAATAAQPAALPDPLGIR